MDLGSAAVIVAGGRGLKEKSNLHIIEELAESLGGAVGASRPVVDLEWLPRERQIGSSGQTVSPKLYIAVGISGAVQHLVGMQSARCIVAITRIPTHLFSRWRTTASWTTCSRLFPRSRKPLRRSRDRHEFNSLSWNAASHRERRGARLTRREEGAYSPICDRRATQFRRNASTVEFSEGFTAGCQA